MRYAGINWNDIVAGDGLCVSFYTQGCPHHCPGCHNPDTWSFEGGKEFPAALLDTIVAKLNAQGIERKFCIMGGEPLCPENQFLTRLLISTVKQHCPNTQIYVWTGYVYEDLLLGVNNHLQYILDNTDVLIDGPYIASERDITLDMRGSKNQRIIRLREKGEK